MVIFITSFIALPFLASVLILLLLRTAAATPWETAIYFFILFYFIFDSAYPCAFLWPCKGKWDQSVLFLSQSFKTKFFQILFRSAVKLVRSPYSRCYMRCGSRAKGGWTHSWPQTDSCQEQETKLTRVHHNAV